MKKLVFALLAMQSFIFSHAQKHTSMQSSNATKGITYLVNDPAAIAADFGKLGFLPQTSGPDAIILSDGSLLINLSKSATPAQRFSYFVADPSALAKELDSKNIDIQQVDDHYIVTTPDGPYIDIRPTINISQPTGKNLMTLGADMQTPAAYPNKECGAFGEWAIPVADLDKSLAFWEQLGFKTAMKQMAPYPHAILSDGDMLIGLHQTTQFTQPGLTYFAPDMKDRIKKLRSKNIGEFRAVAGEGNVVVSLPEGPSVFLFSL